MLSFFPRGVLDEILNLTESVSDGFPSYSFTDTQELPKISKCNGPNCGVCEHLITENEYLMSETLSMSFDVEGVKKSI